MDEPHQNSTSMGEREKYKFYSHSNTMENLFLLIRRFISEPAGSSEIHTKIIGNLPSFEV